MAPESRSIRPDGKKISEAARLLAVAAHDLKNPVSGIMSAAEYLLEDAADLLESEHLAVLQSIESSSRQMLGVIDDLLEIAAIESGKCQLDVQPKNLVRMIQGIVAQSRPAADLKKIHIALEADPDLPPVELDPVRVHHALHRLLSIGIGSAPEGARIGIRVGKEKENALILVGMETGTTSPGGAQKMGKGEAGITLAMLLIEQIAHSHGGALEFGNERGKEQVFRLTLPFSVRARSRHS